MIKKPKPPTPEERKASKLLGHICHIFNVPLKLEKLYRQKYNLPVGRSSKASRARHTTQNLFGGQYEDD